MKSYIFALMTDKRNDFLARTVKSMLWILSLFYGMAVVINRGLYTVGILKGYKASKPVISIGNITVGGVGKTPLVIWIAQQLQERGIKPVILTRGYMAGNSVKSDEVLMMEEALPQVPLMEGANRVVNIQSVVDTLPVDVFICDDAFQHWPLKRDLDIVIIDASNPFGNEALLPRGILREPLGALKRAQVFVLTKINRALDLDALRHRLKHLNSTALVVEALHQPITLIDLESGKLLPLSMLRGQAIVALSAIGDPAYFKSTLLNLEADVKETISFHDHHAYTSADIKSVVQLIQANQIKFCVTTHKDAVKIRSFKALFNNVQFLYVSIELNLGQGKDEFITKIIDNTAS